MDTTEYNTLLTALAAVPAPRHARGQRHAWQHLLVIIAALVNHHQSARAITQWAQFHVSALRAVLPHLHRLPSESTILRTLRCMDVQCLEHQLARLVLTQPPVPNDLGAAPPTCWQGQPVDGKWGRTATAHGARTPLLSVVQHDTGQTLAQIKVSAR